LEPKKLSHDYRLISRLAELLFTEITLYFSFFSRLFQPQGAKRQVKAKEFIFLNSNVIGKWHFRGKERVAQAPRRLKTKQGEEP